MAICSTCSSAIRRLRPQDQPSEREDPDIVIEVPILDLADVNSCWICFKFSRWLQAEIPEYLDEWRRRSLQVKFTAFGRIYSSKPQSDMPLLFSMHMSPLDLGEDDVGCEIELKFMTTTEFSKTTPIGSNHLPHLSTNLSVVDGWLKTCLKDHKRCREDRETWYPSRLLCLSEGQLVRLVISKQSPPKGSYVTLSHRWPEQPFTKLKTSTIAHLQDGIDVSTLPQSFQDAITIARHLRINYLWIDALCISQAEDHWSDWKKESQIMDKIYSCAFLNISATMSINGSESLFQQCSWESLLPSEIDLEVNELTQKYYVQNGNLWYDEIIDAPLNERGWVFQERFLARRVLHFGQRQLGWECQELEALEISPEGLAPASITSSFSKPKVANMMANFKQLPDETLDVEFADLWQELVTQYSKCKLTCPGDKLIAFLGVAKKLMEARSDRYAAGMWRKSMIYDLAWWRLSKDREAFPISKTSKRAPSWSWASVDGEIIFPSTIGGVKEHFVDILDISELVTNESFPFSQRDLIRVKGQCLPLSFECSNEEILGFKVAGFCFDVSEAVQSSSVDLDVSEEGDVLLLAQEGKVLFLPLFATSYFLYGMVIAENSETSTHQRLGAIEIPMGEETIRDDPNSRAGTSQRYERVNEEYAGQLNVSSRSWYVTAVKLVHHLRSPARVQRVIVID